MQLTNEIKAKIFGLYIGCEIQVEGEERICTLSAAVDDGNYKVRYWDADGYEFFWCNISKCKLILSPLSEITDEDAIELYLLVNPEAQDINDKNRHIEYAWWGKQYANANMQAAPYLIVTDYLRSRAYALPYMGIDLFDAGIAIPKTKKL